MRLTLRRAVQIIFVCSFVLLISALYQIVIVIESNSDASAGYQRENGGAVHEDGKRVEPSLRKITSVGSKHFPQVVPNGAEDTQDEFHGQLDSEETLEYAALKATELSDIYISVKTTHAYHSKRLDLLLETWHVLVRDETYFFTDADDDIYQQKTRGHLINTNCSSVHSRKALCCKMSVEFDSYIASNKRWFCHVDDDTYLNIPALLRLLKSRNHTEDWYLGKPSLSHSLEINDIEDKGRKLSFWFATGGAGFCISRSLALKMVPFAGGGKLKTACGKIRLPDDCTIGFIVYHYLKKELTVIPEFHSHLESLWRIKHTDLSDQITLSYKFRKDVGDKNVVIINGFSKEDDPTRFRSIHCYLYPYFNGCPHR